MANFEKPVVFRLGTEEYGIDITIVDAIERYQNIVPVPNSVPYIKGIMNLRGQIIPVLDLRQKFGLGAFTGDSEKRKLIVIKIGDIHVAIEVDEVSEIHRIEPENIIPLPKIVRNDNIKYFTNVGNSNGKLIVLMDVSYLFTEEEQESIRQMKEELEK